jgi:lysophospholipid acyltransferase (LPLAT)-like uncharacterized protein
VTRRRDSLRYRLEVRALGVFGAALIRALGRTWRVSTAGPDPFALEGPVVGALWHEGLFVAAWRWRGRGVAVPVSRSRDGDRIDAVLGRLGFAPSPRGSSSRGASALLRSMIRLARAGHLVAVLPDGPRGPARVAKPGVVALASAADAALVPVAVAARPCLRFGSWDRVMLPLPFARVHCVYGEPIRLPKRSGDADVERWSAELEAALGRLGDAADRALGIARPAPPLEEPGP